MKKGFDWRKLFPLSYYHCIVKGNEFNAFVFYVDILIWSIVLTTVITIIIMLWK